jgi:hypothetical protein
MAKAASKRLVIDTDVVRSAGGADATHPRSQHCRDFLRAVLDICHRVVVTREILDEWKPHASSFARKWHVAMYGKKKVVTVSTRKDDKLLQRIEVTARSEKDRDAILKDMLLVEAALATDQAVVSCDDSGRRLFVAASSQVSELRPIVWVNPDREEEEPIQWLTNGAEAEPNRTLRHFQT